MLRAFYLVSYERYLQSATGEMEGKGRGLFMIALAPALSHRVEEIGMADSIEHARFICGDHVLDVDEGVVSSVSLEGL